VKRNRVLYGLLLGSVTIAAIAYGDPFMFMTLYALVSMPVISLIFALFTLYGLGITQKAEKSIVTKGDSNRYFITFRNRTPAGFGAVKCYFVGEHFAIQTDAEAKTIDVRPFMSPFSITINFMIKYRGRYQLGLDSLEVVDFLRLFRLRRKLSTRLNILAYPQLTSLEYLGVAMHLMSKAPANISLAQEDNTEITDVRHYLPSDPIKKVHWKLTAKRGEWIVKNYQSSALNTMTVMLDSNKILLPYKTSVMLEDKMIEYAVSVVQYCLRSQMPVELLFGRNIRERGQHIGDFESLYDILANVSFESNEANDPIHEDLNRFLNESSRHVSVNVIILTAVLDTTLYERILNAFRIGHFIAVMYFQSGGTPDKASERVFAKLEGSGLPCAKIV